ncbi:AI-2E family transporter [Fluviibacterium sp. DFM31]|uniref:AI-2E family transporter n=1 Tax=Meridianimarinicoccus marinus TaxID=3231483 RepID=A0ABV3L7Z1_9RHOB
MTDAPAPKPPRSTDAIAIDLAIRMGFLALFAYLSLRLVAPFAAIVTWSVVLAVALHPVYAWLAARLGGRRKLAATLLTLVGLLVILGPAAALVTSTVRSVTGFAEKIRTQSLELKVPTWLSEIPVIGPDLNEAWSMMTGNLETFLHDYGATVLNLGTHLLGIAAGLAGGILQFAISMIIAGFLFVPGHKLAEGIRHFGRRIIGDRGAGFVDLAGATIRNVARGVIGVSLLQALLLGIGLIVADVPAAGLLTLAALILAIVQIGAAVVILPLVIWAWTSMGTLPALLFTAYMVPVATVDNILRPIVMAQGLTTPMLVILLGVIGGTVSFGLIGLFMGPIVLAVFYELLMFWVEAPRALAADDAPAPTED